MSFHKRSKSAGISSSNSGSKNTTSPSSGISSMKSAFATSLKPVSVSRSSSRSSGSSPTPSVKSPAKRRSETRVRAKGDGRKSASLETPDDKQNDNTASGSDSESRSLSKRASIAPPNSSGGITPSKKANNKTNRQNKRSSRVLPKPVTIKQPSTPLEDEYDEDMPLISMQARSAPPSSLLARHRSTKSASGLNTAPLNVNNRQANISSWDMPATPPRSREALNWQQTLLSSSQSVDDATVFPPNAHKSASSASHKDKSVRVPQTATMYGIQANPTWGETATSSAPFPRVSPKKSSKAPSRNGNARVKHSSHPGHYSNTSESEAGPFGKSAHQFSQLAISSPAEPAASPSEPFEMDDPFLPSGPGPDQPITPPSSAAARSKRSPPNASKSGGEGRVGSNKPSSQSKANSNSRTRSKGGSAALTRSQSDSTTNTALPANSSPQRSDTPTNSALMIPPFVSSNSGSPYGVGSKYAGPNFHNSPNATALPAPQLGKRTSLVL